MFGIWMVFTYKLVFSHHIYIYMMWENLQDNLYEIIRQKYGGDMKEEFTKSWKIFLDDCFIFWKCPWVEINELHNPLQNLHLKIKFTMEQSLKIKIFWHPYKKRKWPNNLRYLPQTNRHPTIPLLQSHYTQNFIKSISYTLARRILKNKKQSP